MPPWLEKPPRVGKERAGATFDECMDWWMQIGPARGYSTGCLLEKGLFGRCAMKSVKKSRYENAASQPANIKLLSWTEASLISGFWFLSLSLQAPCASWAGTATHSPLS